ncbi:hypothetical protein [Fischerella sp. JS2]|uniref:hypothetical protein n=1 Tax=Fischerella sp. JS2 TaxID=2597771 RepID=UPI0028EAC129|nr:hypothetical protein [Fischerella sp. JS2]
MKKLLSVAKSLRLRQIMTVFLAGLSIFVMQAFSNILPAQADETVKSPYGYYYKGTPDENVVNRDFDQNQNLMNQEKSMAENAKRNLKNTAENVREKLNFDEVQPKSTKNFSNFSNQSGETVKSPYGYYYKGTPDENVANGNFDQNRNLMNNEKSMAENAKRNLKNTAENVREKLNLDEPLPKSTKDLLNSTKQKTEDLVEPITKNREGYYQAR